MTLEVGKIYTLKLNSGEEMIAKVFAEAVGHYITVSNPVSIAPSPQGMGLIPSMFTGNPDQSVTINTNSIAMYCETDESVTSKYVQATTGLAIPEKKVILG